MNRTAPSVLWEELTAREFPEAVRAAGRVCLLPIGCLEKHGDHLPLGTDMYEARELAARAARVEPAIVFPASNVAQIAEARHAPGTLSYSHRLRWAMLEESIDEIVRNGMDRIVILNTHGGNLHFLAYFAQCQLERRCGAQVFVAWPFVGDAQSKAILEDTHDGHGGEMETSLMQAIAPELVQRDRLSAAGERQTGPPVLAEEGLYHALDWYAHYPLHYAGDGAHGTLEKGGRLLDLYVGRIVSMLRAVKADRDMPGLEREFFAAAEALRPPPTAARP